MSDSASEPPIITARVLLKGGHAADLDRNRVDELKKHMAENDGHIVVAYLAGNRELHLFVRDIVAIEIQREASPEMMRAFAAGTLGER
jgi:hypothetical protein